MTSNIVIVIIITSVATYLSRFLGVVSAEKIKETSKMFRWFNCLAYSTLAALIARLVVFPSGPLAEIDPNWFHPLLKVDILEILQKLDKQKLDEFSIAKN